MTKKQLKKKSKRQSSSIKHKIVKKIRDHGKKLKKEARKAKKSGIAVKSMSNKTKIPNLYPNKKELLDEQDMLKEIEKLQNKKGYKGATKDDINNLVVTKENVTVKNVEENNEIKRNEKQSKKDLKKELNNLVSKSNFILEFLDARDPLAYRSKELEHNVITNKDKRLILILNKIDLVSKKSIEYYSTLLRKDYPTILLSNTNKAIADNSIKELVNLIKTMLSQFNPILTNNKVYISIVGYPNTGKRTFIENIKSKFSGLNTSTIVNDSNEITIDYNLQLFDKEGIILSQNQSGALMPKSTKNVDEIKEPLEIVNNLLKKIEHIKLLETFEIEDFENVNEFLTNVAKRNNFLVKVK